MTSTAQARIAGGDVVLLWIALVIGLAAGALLAVPLRGPLNLDRPALASVVQGTVRVNAYVGFAASFAVMGDDGLSLMAAVMARF